MQINCRPSILRQRATGGTIQLFATGICAMSNVLQNNEERNQFSALSDNDDRFQVIFDAVNDGILIVDVTTGKFTDVNRAACSMLGYNKTELIDCHNIGTLSSGIHPYTLDMSFEPIERARSGEPQLLEWQCKTKDGILFWVELSIRRVDFGRIPSIVAVIRDITERKRLNTEIVYMAQHDVLTGLANRPVFTTAVDRAIAQSLRIGKNCSILYLDLDHFKDVNDTRGHLTGDRLLRLVAERLKAAVRLNENVARFGGDEFAILLGDHNEPTEIAALANRLIVSIGKPFWIDGNEVHIGVSIGVAIYGEDAGDAETLLSHADIALYRAKAEGRQTYRFFSDAMNEEVRSRVALTDELRSAISAGQLFLVYQPQVMAKDGRIIGVEALVRWRHPRRGILMPGSFLPMAESAGLMGALGQWVLREACRQGRQWIDAGIVPGRIGVNLSSAQFKAPLEFEKMIFAVLTETRLPPHLLELEITETTLIGLSSDHGEMMERLRRAGVKVALDDFGTGYSSLNYLRRFPVDRIKIAQEFISVIGTSVEAASIVKLILEFSRVFGNATIAEGVETLEQLSLLQDWDCREVQGFYFAPPMSAEAIVPVLSNGTIKPSMTNAAAFAA
jgi:diguanylate cyclase (GGDEF)-like protein/PAS domain S-box-containing protein